MAEFRTVDAIAWGPWGPGTPRQLWPGFRQVKGENLRHFQEFGIRSRDKMTIEFPIDDRNATSHNGYNPQVVWERASSVQGFSGKLRAVRERITPKARAEHPVPQTGPYRMRPPKCSL